MFGQNFQRKYALTDQGVRNTKKGTFWTFLVNLIVMGGMGILYLLMYKLMGTLTEGRPLPSAPPLLGLVVLFVLLSFLTHLQQYKATYGLVYNEVKATRLSLAERLRKHKKALLEMFLIKTFHTIFDHHKQVFPIHDHDNQYKEDHH